MKAQHKINIDIEGADKFERALEKIRDQIELINNTQMVVNLTVVKKDLVLKKWYQIWK